VRVDERAIPEQSLRFDQLDRLRQGHALPSRIASLKLSGWSSAKHGAKLDEYVPPATAARAAHVWRTSGETTGRKTAESAVHVQVESQAGGDALVPSKSVSSWKRTTTPKLADHLATITGAPVVDEAGLPGEYNVIIETSRGTDGEREQNKESERCRCFYIVNLNGRADSQVAADVVLVVLRKPGFRLR
jgi:hypothetical protein